MSGDLVWAVVRLLVALPLVLALAYLVLKYGLARRFVVTPGIRRMKLLEQLPLGPKTTLSLVMLGGRYYLFAHQDNAVLLVKEMEELPEPEEYKAGDIVDFTPRAVREYDSFQGAGDLYASGGSVTYNKSVLKGLAGRLLKTGGFLKGRLFAVKRPGKKGEGKLEG
ncbi:MAG TPA: flagellar biosynthetic protein FliO [Bacillota bacterium]|nr:flagellar biosynthetic protein FliO [Bacillota bacterium]